MAAPIAYSFLDVVASLTGPGGSFSLSDDAVADEGITIAMADDKVSIQTGAGGGAMHSKHEAKNGTVTIRYLKNSPKNRQLMALYNYQNSGGGSNIGQNMISVSNPYWGDDFQCKYGSIQKLPDNVNAKDGGMMEWRFIFSEIDQQLGDGSLVI